MDKKYRLPLGDEQKHELEVLLKAVPTRTVVHIEWATDEGREFVKAVRKAQLAGVPLPWIAEALGLAKAALQGAVGYWERPSTSRRASPKKRVRERRPLSKDDES